MRLLNVAMALVLVTGPALAQSLAPTTSPHPKARIQEGPVVEIQADQNARLQSWLAAFRPRAQAAGIRAETLDSALRGIRNNTTVIKRDRNQSEFTKQIWEYLDSAASDARVANGRAAFAKNRKLLGEIEEEYGVDAHIVAAIWGLESAYGTFRGDIPMVEALATLAFDTRRGRFFEKQLIGALQIIQSGDVAPRSMTGSWAGAMGHTQFIPTSYLAYAVDFTGDGKRDIWSDNPGDALASTANYLAKFGWKKGQHWGVEVILPDGFDYTLAKRTNRKLPSAWAAIGIGAASGKPIVDHGPASILLPAGANGAAFMIFENFDVIEHYNTADAYVIGVGHLADRIAGGDPIKASWPRDDRPLSFDEKQEMQRLLTAMGYSTGGVDGIIGPLTINSVRRFQASVGLIPDGYPSKKMLDHLRG
ncbi:MAG: lytic murein transglycosylase [Rhodobacteraceae bacterium]|nr:lytic murein transglycosylase [Paracoccaceae bacterium]